MQRHDDVTTAVDRIIDEVGDRVVVCTPLGLGKANAIVDELYARALADPGFTLEIVTALGLVPPPIGSDLERRLVGPINDRLFGYRVPDRCRANTPEGLALKLADHQASLPRLPFGSDITDEELTLIRALRHVQGLASPRGVRGLSLGRARRAVGAPPEAARPYLARMGLERPSGVKEQAMARLVTYGLEAVGALRASSA